MPVDAGLSHTSVQFLSVDCLTFAVRYLKTSASLHSIFLQLQKHRLKFIVRIIILLYIEFDLIVVRI